MTETFEQQLAKVTGTIHRVYMDGGEHQRRMENGLLYYFNKADDLRKSTEILMAYGGSRDTSSMLAGMALEVLIKGIARALDNPTQPTHSLTKLADHVGIAVTEDEGIILGKSSANISATSGLRSSKYIPQQFDRAGSPIDQTSSVIA
jgi:hypothetical protein